MGRNTGDFGQETLRKTLVKIAVWLALLPAAAAAATPMLLPLTVRGHTLNVEVVATQAAMAKGLMYRDSLPADQGMLFIEPVARRLSFWMKNTKIPLDIAFLTDDGLILQIEPMTPLDETPILAHYAVRLAIETNHGWWAKNGVKVGDRVSGLPKMQ
jgi:uncharacterized membrane protein (UPF0127 family)